MSSAESWSVFGRLLRRIRNWPVEIMRSLIRMIASSPGGFEHDINTIADSNVLIPRDVLVRDILGRLSDRHQLTQKRRETSSQDHVPARMGRSEERRVGKERRSR